MKNLKYRVNYQDNFEMGEPKDAFIDFDMFNDDDFRLCMTRILRFFFYSDYECTGMVESCGEYLLFLKHSSLEGTSIVITIRWNDHA